MATSGDSRPDELIARARAGDGETLGRLLDIYRNYLRMLAQLQIDRRLQSKVDASDVVQDTFLEVHRNFADFRGATEPEFLEWLRRILASRLRALFRRYYQASSRDVRMETSIDSDLDRSAAAARDWASTQSTPSQAAMAREQGVVLADALSRLPAEYREVLVLRHLEGIPFQEVAWRMEKTVDSVKGLWVRALDALHGVLGEQNDG